jgi:hypothetical protein
MTRYVGPRQIVIDDNPAPVPFWHPERSFAGLAVGVIGGGPSIAGLDLAELAGHRFIAINSGCRKVRPVATADDLLYFTDNSWSENRPQLLRDWPGPIVTSNRNTKARLGDLVRRIDLAALTAAIGGFPDHVQASSGHSAACLAAIMGARRIVLIGFEGCAVGGRTHGHGDYSQHDLGVFDERFLPGWRGLAPVLERYGVEIVNATPISAIREFPFAEFGAALRG